ncbi:MAG TPA: site-2 protease family protein [Usitatibacteraceae bacterium]
MDSETIRQITIYAIPLIFAITLHEAAHAFAARYFGDGTAYMLGRMTLNPLKHIDPVWTIAVPLVLLMLPGSFLLGAAKPVPVNFGALRDPKRDSVWVAAAGPAANLLMMIAWAILLKMVLSIDTAVDLTEPIWFLREMAKAGVAVNLMLMIFNLFPLLPLDGGRIVAGLLPNRLSYQYARLEPYGMFIIIALVVSHVLDPVFGPLVYFGEKAVYSAIGIS